MTAGGGATAVTGLVAVVAGVLLGWTALVLVGAGLLAVVAIGLLLVARPASVQVQRQIAPPRVPKGEPAIAYLSFVNRGWTTAAATVASQPFGDTAVPTVIPRLRRGERGVRTYRLPTSRRGVFEVGPVEIVRRDPFALFRVARRHGGTEQIWVQPRILPLRPPSSGRRRNLEGPSSDAAPQGTVTFHRLRDYVDGDDLRLVHWPSTARTGRLVVKHNVDTSQPYTVVLLDTRPEAYTGEEFEVAVDVTASVVVATSAGKAPVELRLVTGEHLGGARLRNVTPLMDHLTALTAQPRGSLAGELLALRRVRGGTTLVVVTGAVAAADLPYVAALRRRFERVLLVSVGVGRFTEISGVRVLAGPDADTLAAAWNLEVAA